MYFINGKTKLGNIITGIAVATIATSMLFTSVPSFGQSNSYKKQPSKVQSLKSKSLKSKSLKSKSLKSKSLKSKSSKNKSLKIQSVLLSADDSLKVTLSNTKKLKADAFTVLSKAPACETKYKKCLQESVTKIDNRNYVIQLQDKLDLSSFYIIKVKGLVSGKPNKITNFKCKFSVDDSCLQIYRKSSNIVGEKIDYSRELNWDMDFQISDLVKATKLKTVNTNQPGSPIYEYNPTSREIRYCRDVIKSGKFRTTLDFDTNLGFGLKYKIDEYVLNPGELMTCNGTFDLYMDGDTTAYTEIDLNDYLFGDTDGMDGQCSFDWKVVKGNKKHCGFFTTSCGSYMCCSFNKTGTYVIKIQGTRKVDKKKTGKIKFTINVHKECAKTFSFNKKEDSLPRNKDITFFFTKYDPTTGKAIAPTEFMTLYSTEQKLFYRANHGMYLVQVADSSGQIKPLGTYNFSNNTQNFILDKIAW